MAHNGALAQLTRWDSSRNSTTGSNHPEVNPTGPQVTASSSQVEPYRPQSVVSNTCATSGRTTAESRSRPAMNGRYLSVTGFVINIESFTMMMPELLERQQYVCTYHFSQDHLELFFNSIKASGDSGNVKAQDNTVCLSAIDMSSVVPTEDNDDIATSPFEWVTAHQCSESLLSRVVKAELGSEDVFSLSDHSVETQDGIDNHHFDFISLILSCFHKLRQHHVAKVHTLQLQSSSLRKKLCKVVLLQRY
ncbi:hypothetical protein QQF64_035927 [Cirrhinus molitorella]|uniref:Transposable element P transposase-like RNase H C-terminal domain-containing protein n=1 Tax=Cirrhinus molitorella TaxID=172907 RepID=A0ABR3NHB8_9TELE